MTGKKISASLLCLLALALSGWCTLQLWNSAVFNFFLKVLLMGVCAAVACAAVFVYFSYLHEIKDAPPAPGKKHRRQQLLSATPAKAPFKAGNGPSQRPAVASAPAAAPQAPTAQPSLGQPGQKEGFRAGSSPAIAGGEKTAAEMVKQPYTAPAFVETAAPKTAAPEKAAEKPFVGAPEKAPERATEKMHAKPASRPAPAQEGQLPFDRAPEAPAVEKESAAAEKRPASAPESKDTAHRAAVPARAAEPAAPSPDAKAEKWTRADESVPAAKPGGKSVYRRPADKPAPQKSGDTVWHRTTETVERPDGTKFDTQTFTINLGASRRNPRQK